MTEAKDDRLLQLTAGVVAAYVTKNPLHSGDVGRLIIDVYSALRQEVRVREPVAEQQPAIHPKKSVHKDYIVCLEDGGHFKSLKRHLLVQYNLTPDQYRAKWKLPRDYPMVAPNYAQARSKLAKANGLGRKHRG